MLPFFLMLNVICLLAAPLDVTQRSALRCEDCEQLNNWRGEREGDTEAEDSKELC